jgi:MFS family permease
MRFEKTTLLAGALLVFGAMLMLMPHLTSLWLLVPLIAGGGMAWSAIVSTMNAAAQASFPQAIRARTLSIYLFVMAGGYALGSLVWGRVADHAGVKVAFTIAGACMVVNAAVLATRKHDNPI